MVGDVVFHHRVGPGIHDEAVAVNIVDGAVGHVEVTAGIVGAVGAVFAAAQSGPQLFRVLAVGPGGEGVDTAASALIDLAVGNAYIHKAGGDGIGGVGVDVELNAAAGLAVIAAGATEAMNGQVVKDKVAQVALVFVDQTDARVKHGKVVDRVVGVAVGPACQLQITHLPILHVLKPNGPVDGVDLRGEAVLEALSVVGGEDGLGRVLIAVATNTDRRALRTGAQGLEHSGEGAALLEEDAVTGDKGQGVQLGNGLEGRFGGEPVVAVAAGIGDIVGVAGALSHGKGTADAVFPTGHGEGDLLVGGEAGGHRLKLHRHGRIVVVGKAAGAERGLAAVHGQRKLKVRSGGGEGGRLDQGDGDSAVGHGDRRQLDRDRGGVGVGVNIIGKGDILALVGEDHGDGLLQRRGGDGLKFQDAVPGDEVQRVGDRGVQTGGVDGGKGGHVQGGARHGNRAVLDLGGLHVALDGKGGVIHIGLRVRALGMIDENTGISAGVSKLHRVPGPVAAVGHSGRCLGTTEIFRAHLQGPGRGLDPNGEDIGRTGSEGGSVNVVLQGGLPRACEFCAASAAAVGSFIKVVVVPAPQGVVGHKALGQIEVWIGDQVCLLVGLARRRGYRCAREDQGTEHGHGERQRNNSAKPVVFHSVSPFVRPALRRGTSGRTAPE